MTSATCNVTRHQLNRATLNELNSGNVQGPVAFAGVATLDPIDGYKKGQAVVTQDDRIIATGDAEVLLERYPKVYSINAAGFILSPGFVNAHVHCAMGFFRGLGHGRPNMIEDFFFPAERALQPEYMEALSYSYLLDCLRSGVTTVGEHFYFVEGIGQAIEKLGMRGVIGETVADLGGAFPGREGFHRTKKLLDKWPFSRRITPVVAPHAANTVSLELMGELAEFAAQNNLGIHMHLAQTASEGQQVRERHPGFSPVKLAASAGLLSPKTLAVHLLDVDQEDLAILQSHEVSVGYCPASQIIYERLAPIELFRQHKLNIALGTDCAASNDGGNLISEMRLAALLSRDRNCDEGPREAQVQFHAATLGGAQALNLEGVVGRIAPGYQADLVFIKPDLTVLPWQDPFPNLVYSCQSRHVKHVMIAGSFCLFDGELERVSEADCEASYLAMVAKLRQAIGSQLTRLPYL